MTPRFFAALSAIGVLALLAGGASAGSNGAPTAPAAIVPATPRPTGTPAISGSVTEYHGGSVKGATIAKFGVFQAPSA